eukprot:XP_015133881.2 serine-rich and transmembrane domain-containing protein 1 isoform X2 [Gallus gallus]
MTACMMTYIQKPAEQKDFGQSAREARSAQHPPPAGAGAEAVAPLLRPHRTAPPRGWGPPAGRGRARGGPGAVLPAGPRGTAAAAAAAEPESGRGGRHGSGAEPGAVSGAGGRGFLGARRCGGAALLSEGFVRGFSQRAVPLDLGAITNHLRHIGLLACILLSSCFSEEHTIPLPWT